MVRSGNGVKAGGGNSVVIKVVTGTDGGSVTALREEVI